MSNNHIALSDGKSKEDDHKPSVLGDLLCCPFCGNLKPYLHSNRVWKISESSIWCDLGGCGARGPKKDTDQEAIEAWNRRAT